jgi:hypothetical protein
MSKTRRVPQSDSTFEPRRAQAKAGVLPLSIQARRDTLGANSMKTFDLLGTPLVATSYDELIAHVHELARDGGTHAVDLTNTHIVTLRRQDPHFLEITSEFDYFIPDGMPLVWCLNARGAGLRDRVYGPVFMRKCLETSPAPWTHYLLGGSPECVAALRAKFAGPRGSLARIMVIFRLRKSRRLSTKSTDWPLTSSGSDSARQNNRSGSTATRPPSGAE